MTVQIWMWSCWPHTGLTKHLPTHSIFGMSSPVWYWMIVSLRATWNTFTEVLELCEGSVVLVVSSSFFVVALRHTPRAHSLPGVECQVSILHHSLFLSVLHSLPWPVLSHCSTVAECFLLWNMSQHGLAVMYLDANVTVVMAEGISCIS